MAAGAAARGEPRRVRRANRRPDAGPAHHGFARCAARVHQIGLGLSGHSRERRPDPERPGDSVPLSKHFRWRRKSLWRRPLHHRRDLGGRVELRHADRGSLGDPFDGDARLHRPSARFFPRGISLGAGDSRARRRARGSSQRVMGGRVRPDPVHADGFQALCRGFRPRWPPRRRRLGARCHRLDREQSQARRLGKRADVGLRGGAVARIRFPAGGARAHADDARMGARRHSPGGRQGVCARGRPRLSAGARGRARPGIPDAAEFPRDHEIQSGRGLCAGHRPSRRPPARRCTVRAGLAAP